MRGIAWAEQRTCPRAPGRECGLASARLRHGLDLMIVNMAEGGALVEAAARLLPGSNVELQLAAPGWRWLAPARVLRCQVSALVPEQGVRYRAALQFDRPLRLPGHERDEGRAAGGSGASRPVWGVAPRPQRMAGSGGEGSCYPVPPRVVSAREAATRFPRTPPSDRKG
jgi:hypothetical protein